MTVWASIRDLAFIRTWTSEVLAFIKGRRLFETRRLIEVLW